MESNGDFCYLVKWLWDFWTFWGSELQNTSWPCWNILLITWILWCLWKHQVASVHGKFNHRWVKCGGNPFHWMLGHTPEFLIKDGHPFQLTCLVFPPPQKKRETNTRTREEERQRKIQEDLGEANPATNLWGKHYPGVDEVWRRGFFFTKRPQGQSKNPWKIIAMLNFMPFLYGKTMMPKDIHNNLDAVTPNETRDYQIRNIVP